MVMKGGETVSAERHDLAEFSLSEGEIEVIKKLYLRESINTQRWIDCFEGRHLKFLDVSYTECDIF
jgi:hypothetical protein